MLKNQAWKVYFCCYRNDTFLNECIKYTISATAVIIQEHGYNRNNDGIVWKYANIVYTHATLNTHEPIITTIVGTIVLPSPLDAAIVQSINEDTAYENPIIIILCIKALP